MDKIYLQFVGPSNNGITVEGQVTTRDFSRAIEILSFSLGISTSGLGTGASKVQFSTLNLMKAVDSASVPLFNGATSGALFPQVRLTIRQQDATGKEYNYLQYDFAEVLVTSVQWSGSEGENSPAEEVSLVFAKVEITYLVKNSSGSPVGTQTGGWNIVTNVPS